MIFKGVRDGRPYPDHGLSHRQWAQIPPRQIRLDELVTTTTVLALDRLLSEDSTFYGDLFPHAVRWKGIVYLEDGLHRAVRAALRNRTVLHARVFDMDMPIAQARLKPVDRDYRLFNRLRLAIAEIDTRVVEPDEKPKSTTMVSKPALARATVVVPPGMGTQSGEQRHLR